VNSRCFVVHRVAPDRPLGKTLVEYDNYQIRKPYYISGHNGKHCGDLQKPVDKPAFEGTPDGNMGIRLTEGE